MLLKAGKILHVVNGKGKAGKILHVLNGKGKGKILHVLNGKGRLRSLRLTDLDDMCPCWHPTDSCLAGRLALRHGQ